MSNEVIERVATDIRKNDCWWNLTLEGVVRAALAALRASDTLPNGLVAVSQKDTERELRGYQVAIEDVKALRIRISAEFDSVFDLAKEQIVDMLERNSAAMRNAAKEG